jgi:hypothetical protein
VRKKREKSERNLWTWWSDGRDKEERGGWANADGRWEAFVSSGFFTWN